VVYGPRVFDVLFGAGGMGGGSGFDLATLMETRPCVRITTFTDAKMFKNKLTEYFGASEWDDRVCESMRVALHEDLTEGNSFNYMSEAALFDLYEVPTCYAHMHVNTRTVAHRCLILAV
jgi:hypothetical protein